MDFLYQFFGWVLFVIYGLVKNYGVAIIIFTVLVKTAILPLNIKQTNSMRETQAIQPEVQELQKKYKNNPEKLQAETMKLYKLYKINPMAGCLPLLIQLPILWGLFGALRDPGKWVFTNGDLSALQTYFLWITNLGDKDPWYILPILCVVFTFAMQKYTMSMQTPGGDKSMESTQKMMLYVMPIMIGWMAINMPSGVALYWVVQNIYTFAQQFLVMRKPIDKISKVEAERRVAEADKQRIKEQKEARKQQSELRQDAMNAQMGKAPKNKNKGKTNKPKTQPASKKNKSRKTITSIPKSDERSKKS